MSRTTHSDQVIDDDDVESCPLCIEELDLSDRNFFPCPCGYQICQFCYNNIKTTMNGLCPACRRQYDEKNVVFKQPTQEQLATHKEAIAQQAKKKAAARQKEAAKREADTLSRKHLAGIRVRQKNLVYITGMRPATNAENLSEALRHDEYFGQYGKIIKVVVSKAKDTASANAPVGVYVTFETKEAAARCIQAVDGSQNYDTRLRAQYGTTKYCSAYLRGEVCGNRGCMFLHEPGDENESFSRQDLSSMNVISTQSPAQANILPSGQPPHPQPPPQHAPQSIAAASHVSERRDSKEDSHTLSDTPEGPALPSSANWGSRRGPNRQTAQLENTNASSPVVTNSTPEPQRLSPPGDSSQVTQAQSPSPDDSVLSDPLPSQKPYKPRKPPSSLTLYRQALASEDFKFVFDEESLDATGRELAQSLPPLFDPNGAARRRLNRKETVEQHMRENDNEVATQALAALSASDLDEGAVAGSFQLGGEPEDQGLEMRARQNVIQPPALENISSPIFGMDQVPSPTAPSSNLNLNTQQQKSLLQSFKSGTANSQPSGQSQGPQGQGPGHGRQASRFSFANDSSASASVNPVANPKVMNQQKSMMPPSHFQQQSSSQYFPSGVQGPPPGLKTTGTPPVSGGGMFGQGHGFATAGLNYGVNATGRSANDEMLRELIRNRGGSAGGGQTSDAGRREYMFPSLPRSSTPSSRPGLSSFPFGPQSGASQDHGPPKQKKKGKKHRHANTSSSGGGVVDLADPSILQTRMHQASTAGSQGLYASPGQGQDISSQSPSQLGLSSPKGLSEYIHRTHSRTSSAPNSVLRKPTPVLPPGLNIPFMRSQAEPMSDNDPSLMPELGRLPETPSSPHGDQEGQDAGHVANVERAVSSQPHVKTEDPSTAPSSTDDASFPALPKLKPSASIVNDTSDFKAPLVRSNTKAPVTRFKAEKLDSRTTSSERDGEPQRAQPTVERDEMADDPSSKKATYGSKAGADEDARSQKQPQKMKSPTPKRQHPGKLDIAAAREINDPEEDFNQPRLIGETESPLKSAAEGTSTTPSAGSRPETPGNFTDAPSRKSTQPRTLRVLATPTPKTETPPPTSIDATAAVPKPSSSRTTPRPSRQASVASVAIPDTPVSEQGAADTASVTTESQSRANSPPPLAKVGSAPVRAKTKNQQKKERRERSATEKSDVALEPSAQPDIIHEPIVGRKKKAKKPTQALPPKPVRPPSPKSKPGERDEEEEPSSKQPTAVDSGGAPQDGIKTEKPAGQSFADEEKKQSPLVNSILESLLASGEVSQETLTNLFKSTPTFVPKSTLAADLKSPISTLPLSRQEMNQLNAGIPVRRSSKQTKSKADKNAGPADRILITPYSRLCIRGLPQELEDRLVELDKRISGSQPPKKYCHRPSDSAAAAAAKVVDEVLRDITNAVLHPEPTSTAEKSVHQSSRDNEQQQRKKRPSDQQWNRTPVYADDALSYLNQFILPLASHRSVSNVMSNSLGRHGLPDRPAHLGGDGSNAASYTTEPLESDISSISNAIPRTYTSGEPTYSISGVDVANKAPLASTSEQATGGTPSLDLKPLPHVATCLPPITASISADHEHHAGQAARHTPTRDHSSHPVALASEASTAPSPAHTKPRRASDTGLPNESGVRLGGWQTHDWPTRALSSIDWKSTDWQSLNASIEEDLKNLPTLANLPPEMMNLGAEAIRQAIMSTGLSAGRSLASAAGTSPSRGVAAERKAGSKGDSPRSGSLVGSSGARENAEEANKLMGEIETALMASKKELESVEKRLNGVVRRNRRAVGV